MEEIDEQARARSRRWFFLACTIFGLTICSLTGGYLAWANMPLRVPETIVPLPSPNGYDACIRALSALPPSNSKSLLHHSWDLNAAGIRKALQPVEPKLAAVRQAMQLEYQQPRPGSSNLSGLFTATDGFVAEARLSQLEGRPDRAVAEALDAVELATRVSHGTLGDYYWAMQRALEGDRMVERCASQLSPESADAAGRRMDVLISRFPRMEDVMEFTRPAVLTETKEELTLPRGAPGTIGGVSVSDLPWDWSGIKERSRLYLSPKPLRYAGVDTAWRQATQEFRKPARDRQFAQIFAGIVGDISPKSRIWSPWHEKGMAMMRLVRLELALQAYRRGHGSYPTHLSNLLPGVAPESLADPFDGQPLRYRKTKKGCLLYSIGPDGIDDGGNAAPLPGALTGDRGDLVAGQHFGN